MQSLTPMPTVNKPAKLFQRFMFEKDMLIGDELAEAQFANFVNYKKIKWAFETKTEYGHYKLDGRIFDDAATVHIRTNSQDMIKAHDIIWLVHPQFPQGRYYHVKEPIEITTVQRPKTVIGFQHLTLETVNFKKPNIEVNNEEHNA